ncbi:acetolactate synthase small subunit [Sulfuriroseicoccus oceanibius]|uniref:Acetolactate synthase small subunit n=1 Tax=Sulfuriroseicoccus oceanibius TaxID=2707525 RepID=A0A6B3LDH3_9BACT|nr:acetolactate synthase small subunit [Sulfuriroseicoccus oceanibius]QQL45029.1 acetolactate synthase small subunit [Sulfuriroseicoccus oceanibius]
MTQGQIITTDSKNVPPAVHEGGHTLSVHVSNEPGVLARIAQVFSRRGYNIDSLVVSQGRDSRFSRMTIGVSGDPAILDQIIRQVNKLIDVIHCSEHDSSDSVVKELILVKMRVGSDDRTEALQVIEHFNGKVVDMTMESMVAMIPGNTEKIDAALRMLMKFDVVETVRTGKVVMARGEEPT